MLICHIFSFVICPNYSSFNTWYGKVSINSHLKHSIDKIMYCSCGVTFNDNKLINKRYNNQNVNRLISGEMENNHSVMHLHQNLLSIKYRVSFVNNCACFNFINMISSQSNTTCNRIDYAIEYPYRSILKTTISFLLFMSST